MYKAILESFFEISAIQENLANLENFQQFNQFWGNFQEFRKLIGIKIVDRTYSFKNMNSFYRNKLYITYSETFISLYEQLIPK